MPTVDFYVSVKEEAGGGKGGEGCDSGHFQFTAQGFSEKKKKKGAGRHSSPTMQSADGGGGKIGGGSSVQRFVTFTFSRYVSREGGRRFLTPVLSIWSKATGKKERVSRKKKKTELSYPMFARYQARKRGKKGEKGR